MPKNQADYDRIKKKIAALGLAIPGTIRETYLLCGKPGCACAHSDDARHGPYYLWNRKVNGKLTSKSIPKDQLRLFEEWIGNRRKLEGLVDQLLEIGAVIAIGPTKRKRGKN